MPTSLDRAQVRKHLADLTLQALFIEELGWDHGGEDIEAPVDDATFALQAISQKRGMVVYQHRASSVAAFPDQPTRQKIERIVTKTVHEHLIIYVTHDNDRQVWQWVRRQSGQPARSRQHIHHQGHTGEALTQKLEQLVFTLDEEEDLSIVDVSGRVRAAFDVEKVTKRFYDRFKKEHGAFLGFVDGITAEGDREWYASLMLNRMMFIYFIQKRGFLDADVDYLRNRLNRLQDQLGSDRFHTFYRIFLLRLFHQGLSLPEKERPAELSQLLGRVPYLNGGLFEEHDLERDNPQIHIPDEAFIRIFEFFDAYQWHLDDRPLRNDKEINPDVLGYIFEKYVNQKQMGAYYTKEDITGYIGRNTILPFLCDRAQKECAIAFKPHGAVWRLLMENPDRYVYPAVRHGITYDVHKGQSLTDKRQLPAEIAAGLPDVSQRGNWNQAAPPDFALPTETWREHVARRQRYEEIHGRLNAGKVTSIDDLITYNLDIETFALDVIAGSEGPELVRAFWKAISQVSVLDPTCGSGAFLFAALNILEPLYTACLQAMGGFVDDMDRSQRKRGPKPLSDFREVLRQVDEHASERYFIFKSIIINNLYGVDIMEEAVEICKLRLFLKLVAELESYEQIEPLPDVDFNIRAGNTLVGFTSLKGVQDAFTLTTDGQHRMLYPQELDKLKRIEEDAAIADRAFGKFRDMQTEHGMDASAFTDAKQDLRKRLDSLRGELDQFLAGAHGLEVGNVRTYREWQQSLRPFHWIAEFYGIMRDGGFDVIIGNPPYIEISKASGQYALRHYELLRTGNLYAVCLERFFRLLGSDPRYGVIVPISSVSTPRMLPLMRLLVSSSSIHISNFAVRPAKLFSGVDMNLSILIGTPWENKDLQRIHTTAYTRWNEPFRKELFRTISYVESTFFEPFAAVAKINSEMDRSILTKLMKFGPLTRFRTRRAENPIFYHSGGRYFRKCIKRKLSNEYKELSVRNEATDPTLCLLSSSLYYWLWIIFSDCYHVTRPDIDMIPVPDSITSDAKFQELSNALLDDLEKNAEIRSRRRADGSEQEEVNYAVGKSKHLMDEIDHRLAAHYGLSEEEVCHLVNYDAKYRVSNIANPR